MLEQIFQYISHPFAVALFGFLAFVAIVALLLRFFQFRRRNQNLKLKKGISRHVDDEMAWMKSDISVVIENELIKLKKNISISIEKELLQLKTSIPVLVKDEIDKVKESISGEPEKKVIDLDKNRSIRFASDTNVLKKGKHDATDVEKRIDKLDRNMSILMALLVEMKHVAATGKERILKNNSKKKVA
jgi:hypothetical protein